MPEEKKTGKTLHVDTLHIHAKDIVFHRDEEAVETSVPQGFPFQGFPMPQGFQAPQGFQGPQGFQAPQGFQGPQGFQAPQGLPNQEEAEAVEGAEAVPAPQAGQFGPNGFPQVQRDLWGFPVYNQGQPFGAQPTENVVQENITETTVQENVTTEQVAPQGPNAQQPGLPQQGPFGWI